MLLKSIHYYIIRYRNVGSGNSVTVEVDSEYTHDDIYYSRARLTCEGLTFGYTQKRIFRFYYYIRNGIYLYING